MSKFNSNVQNEDEYYPVCINGEVFNCCSSMSLQDILIYLNFNVNLVIVEYNKKIVHQEEWSNICLSVNDSVEVITIAGGG